MFVFGLEPFMTRLLRILCCAIALFCAAQPSSSEAACYPQGQQISAELLKQFSDNPRGLLDQFPSGGAGMISRVRDLVASDPSTLPSLLAQASAANKDQLSALGTGLGQAALVCVRTDQAFANQIQQSVAGLGNGDLNLAFLAVLGDKPIGAVGGGAGGSAGGSGGQTNPILSTNLSSNSSGTPQGTTSTSTATTATNFLSFTGNAVPGSLTSNTASNSVSPTQ
jgi:hypothetical protein